MLQKIIIIRLHAIILRFAVLVADDVKITTQGVNMSSKSWTQNQV